VFSPPTLEARDRAIPAALVDQARTWPVVVDLDPADHAPYLAGVFLRCCRCGQGLARLAWGMPGHLHPLHVQVQDVEAGVLRHLMQAHRPEIDPEWSGT
jgi:hypothetical protein